MSNTEVTQPRSLQDRVGDRIRDQIGDLMTDEDLKTLVDRALNEAFFTKRPIPKKNYHDEQKFDDAFAVAHVHKLLEGRVEAACKAWLSDHKDELGAHIDNAIAAGFSRLMLAWLDNKVNTALFEFGNNLRQQMNMPR